MDGCRRIQRGTCPPKLGRKCRECIFTTVKTKQSSSCRFVDFRVLYYTKSRKKIVHRGFLDPKDDVQPGDRELWLPTKDPKIIDKINIDATLAKSFIERMGDDFCELVSNELKVENEYKNSQNSEKPISWKRHMKGVREMCDVCETTLFNYSWLCEVCGFIVCLNCFNARKVGEIVVRTLGESTIERDEFQWLLCTSKIGQPLKPHVIENLNLTKTIPDDVLDQILTNLHDMRSKFDIPQKCSCSKAIESEQKKLLEPTSSKSMDVDTINGNGCEEASTSTTTVSNGNSVEGEANSHEQSNNTGNGTECEKNGGSKNESDSEDESDMFLFKDPELFANNKNVEEEKPPIINSPSPKKAPIAPSHLMMKLVSHDMYPNVPHGWLCYNKLLRLLDPNCKDNTELFQNVWAGGLPIIVSNVSEGLDKELWHPDAFSRDFGHIRNDLVNCKTNKTLTGLKMKAFWNGFENISKRLPDEAHNPMILKLKDWPPKEDFAVMLESRFNDLMKALPLKDYTWRDGRLNLASRLPDVYIKPDLGPKMYIAYGSGLHLEYGTTNLHLDISDAVNLLVYIGVPKDVDNSDHEKAVREAIDGFDCDFQTKERLDTNKELPGALWHIYQAKDAPKIRDLLYKVTLERNIRPESTSDPIHDQCWYLDENLRRRLRDEYNVQGFQIVQFMGDAVFIPAGAPHQVRNLHNCIKIAEDFVSAENVQNCLSLTEEFRKLSAFHTNREDKLQIKNIMYHSVKDSLSVLNNL